jgi:hypothetical protein
MQSGPFVSNVSVGHPMKLRVAQIACVLFTPFDLVKILRVRVLEESQERQEQNLKRDILKIVIERLLETGFFDQKSMISCFPCNWSNR